MHFCIATVGPLAGALGGRADNGAANKFRVTLVLCRAKVGVLGLVRGLVGAMSRRRGFTISRRATNVALLEGKALRKRVGGLALGASAVRATKGLVRAQRALTRNGGSFGGARIEKGLGATIMSFVSEATNLRGGEHHTNTTRGDEEWRVLANALAGGFYRTKEKLQVSHGGKVSCLGTMHAMLGQEDEVIVGS